MLIERGKQRDEADYGKCGRTGEKGIERSGNAQVERYSQDGQPRAAEGAGAQYRNGGQPHGNDRGIGLLGRDGERNRGGHQGDGGGDRQGTGQALPDGHQNTAGHGNGDERPGLVDLPARNSHERTQAAAQPEPANRIEGRHVLVVHVRIAHLIHRTGEELRAEGLVHLHAIEPQAGGRQRQAHGGQGQQGRGEVGGRVGQPGPPAWPGKGLLVVVIEPPHAQPAGQGQREHHTHRGQRAGDHGGIKGRQRDRLEGKPAQQRHHATGQGGQHNTQQGRARSERIGAIGLGAVFLAHGR